MSYAHLCMKTFSLRGALCCIAHKILAPSMVFLDTHVGRCASATVAPCPGSVLVNDLIDVAIQTMSRGRCSDDWPYGKPLWRSIAEHHVTTVAAHNSQYEAKSVVQRSYLLRCVCAGELKAERQSSPFLFLFVTQDLHRHIRLWYLKKKQFYTTVLKQTRCCLSWSNSFEDYIDYL